MKKIIPLATLLVIFLGISACSNQTKSDNAASKSETAIVNKPEQTVSKSTIKQNKARWDKETKSLKLVHDKTSVSDLATFPKDLKSLKKNNDYVISGTVINLQKMTDNNQSAMTKATILVDRVISGNEKLSKHKIKVTFNGGITKNKKSQKVFVQKNSTPIPTIGSKIITGVNTNYKDDADDKQAAYLKENNLGGSDSFEISVPEYNLWVKNKHDKKYSLNNPQLTGKKVSDSDKKYAKQLKKLTLQLNNNYNN